jgi:hypothetical protein
MKNTAAALWTRYRDNTVVRRAEHYAKFTIPSLMVDPLTGDSPEDVRHDFQSSGSLLLNNLAAKLTSLLFPSNQPFFKNVITQELRAQAKRTNIPEEVVAAQLSTLEQEATKNLVKNASFAKLTKAIKLVIATGQALMYRDSEKQKFRVWSLQSFSVKRDAYGDWRCIVLKQPFLFDELPANILRDVEAKFPSRYKPDSKVDLYTKILRVPGGVNERVKVTNEVDGHMVGPHSVYPVHLCPWVLPVWNLADGEDYARGLVEEYAGDFSKLSILSEQLGLYELDSLEMLNLVDPAGGSIVDDFKGANSGEWLSGSKDSVSSFERGDYNKIASVRNGLTEIVQRLSLAFMYTGNTRNAERVTAEEIKSLAAEAESMLGGAYSILAESMQSPLAYLMMREVSDEILSGLITKTFYPQIITGIPALNRNVEVQNFLAAVQEASAVVPVLPQVDARLDPVKVLDMLYRNRSVDTAALFKDPAQLDKEAADAKRQADVVAQQAAAMGPAAQPTPLTQIV